MQQSMQFAGKEPSTSRESPTRNSGCRSVECKYSMNPRSLAGNSFVEIMLQNVLEDFVVDNPARPKRGWDNC